MAGIETDPVEEAIYRTIETDLAQHQETQHHSHEFSPSIYRVLRNLRDVSPDSYTPRVVSLGPFHKGAENLKKAERYKLSCVLDLFGHLESTREQRLKACIRMMHAKLPRIKASYEGDTMSYDDHEFAKMMVVDACFIINFVYNYRSSNNSGTIINETRLLNLHVHQDLVLLENQIPFFVLQDVFECTIGVSAPGASLVNLFLSFLKVMNPFTRELVLDGTGTNHDHILGLLHKCYQHQHPDADAFSAYMGTPPNWSIRDLGWAGVQFRPNPYFSGDSEGVLSMKFQPYVRHACGWLRAGKRILSMPMLRIGVPTELILRNLIAYEQCSPAVPHPVTSYVVAMGSLLQTKDDFVMAIREGIVGSSFGSIEQVSSIFSSLCKEVMVKDFSYLKEWRQLDDFYNSFWPKNMARLRSTYPWSSIGILSVSGIILFGLTAVQTYFTVRPL